MHQIVAWVVAAVVGWLGPACPREVVERGVGEIVELAYDAGERPLFAGPAGRARTALLVAAVAALESGFREDVQAGRCRPWECDHGKAACWMQVHVGRGVVLDDWGWRFAQAGDAGEVLRAADMVDERACLRVGLHMLGASILHTGTLREYTGERGQLAPKAAMRMRAAADYAHANPPPLVDDDVD
jgi:hypothetical protein